MQGSSIFVDDRRVAKDKPRRWPPGTRLGSLQGLHLPHDLVAVPDIILIGQKNEIGPLPLGLKQQSGEIVCCAEPRRRVVQEHDPPIDRRRFTQYTPRAVAALVVSRQQRPFFV